MKYFVWFCTYSVCVCIHSITSGHTRAAARDTHVYVCVDISGRAHACVAGPGCNRDRDTFAQLCFV